MANSTWQKGMKSPNPAGRIYRERISKVQKKSSLERKINIYLTKQWGRMVEDMDKLSERDRVRAFLELLSYGQPKKAAVNGNNLTNEEVETLYNRLSHLANAKDN